jgi:hypothetical protein
MFVTINPTSSPTSCAAHIAATARDCLQCKILTLRNAPLGQDSECTLICHEISSRQFCSSRHCCAARACGIGVLETSFLGGPKINGCKKRLGYQCCVFLPLRATPQPNDNHLNIYSRFQRSIVSFAMRSVVGLACALLMLAPLQPCAAQIRRVDVAPQLLSEQGPASGLPAASPTVAVTDKDSWPEAVGLHFSDAEALIRSQAPDVVAVLPIRPGQMVTLDWSWQRVRANVDDADVVVAPAPARG